MKTKPNVQSNARFLRVASVALLLLGCVFLARESFAGVARFNFENLATTSGGALSSLTLTEGGVTMTLTRGSDAHFDIFDLSIYSGPPTWGARSLDPFQEGNFNPGRQFIADFDPPVCVFQVQFGDYDGDDDNFVLNAYDGPGGTGNLIDSETIFWSINKTFPDDVGRGTVSGGTGSISSVTFDTTGSYYNSVYYDNIVVKTRTTDHMPPWDDGVQRSGTRQSIPFERTSSGGVRLTP